LLIGIARDAEGLGDLLFAVCRLIDSGTAIALLDAVQVERGKPDLFHGFQGRHGG
jgi:hypothetical protein